MSTSGKSSGLKLPSKVQRPSEGAAKAPAEAPTLPAQDGAAAAGLDFQVGDRVWVNGNKAGYVRFMGATQFAPGQWAGIVLDDPIGKNDGSVAGVRYFQCEDGRGIFTRPPKLSKTANEEEKANEEENAPTGPTATESASNDLGDPDLLKKTRRELRLGERVLVGGNKAGVVRFLGETEFAKGDWCGVELDEPLGKNDGAVAGMRYFQCSPGHGLFAPVHKVTRIGFPSTTPAKAKSSGKRSSLLKKSSSVVSSSVSSLSSAASSIGGKPSRTGLLTETSARYARKISGTTALQEALKEKQQHIEQLLAERDLERCEVAKASSRAGEAQLELGLLKKGRERYASEMEAKLDDLRSLVEAADRDKVELLNQLEEEKRKVEDLQFRVEEAFITKGDLETQTRLEHVRIKELERNLQLETAKAEKLQRDLEDARVAAVAQCSRLAELERQVSDLQQRRQTEGAEQEIAALKTQIDVQIGELNAERESKGAELRRLREESKSEGERFIQAIADLREKLTKAMEELEKTTDRLQQQTNEKQALESEIAELRGEKTVTTQMQQTDPAEQRPLGNGGDDDDDAALQKLKEEKEFAEGQVDFLNSVIVDLQRKNDELKAKLKKLALAEFNGDSGEDGFGQTSSVKREKKTTPRLFCDICDHFDLHDTEDCPTQAQSPDAVPHTAYHGKASDERPYCEICEAFGHETLSCNDDRTF